MYLLRLSIFGAILGAFFGCKAPVSSPTGGTVTAPQYTARLFPITVWAARDLDLPTYTLDARRGTLTPSVQRFSVVSGTPFTAFASGEYASETPQRYWVRTELSPIEYIIVSPEDVALGEVQQGLEPAYVTETRHACPLLAPRPMRLVPIANLRLHDRLFLFSDPDTVSTEPGAVQRLYGHYASPLTSVAYVTPTGYTFTAFVASACLSHPTPWHPSQGPVIGLEQLGSASGFRDTLIAHLRLTEPTNVASSQREKMRLNQESCEDILRDIPEVLDALVHNPAGDSLPSAAVFLCAEPDTEDPNALVYHMKPTTIGVELVGNNVQPVALLVINLSPPDFIASKERELAFGAYSYSDMYQTDEMIAIPAFDGVFGEVGTGVYRVTGGIRNAIWVIIEPGASNPSAPFRYSSGKFNENVLSSQEYFEQPWWDGVTSITGRISHD